MKAATERKIIRWIHILLSVPLLGYVYGPLGQNAGAAWAIRWLYLPIVVLTGLWLWKGHWLKKLLRRPNGQVNARIKNNT
jgi:hypothetical protein